MIEKFQGGPVGLDTLAAAVSEDAGTLEDVYEPYLLKNGFIQRTPRGRVVTALAYRHLGNSPSLINRNRNHSDPDNLNPMKKQLGFAGK